MAELEGQLRIKAAHNEPVSLMPDASESDGQDITSSKRLAVSPGDHVSFSSTEAWFLKTAAADATASNTSTPMPKGFHSMVVPTGVGSVAMFSATAGARGNLWKS